MSALLAQSRVLTGTSWKKCEEHITGKLFYGGGVATVGDLEIISHSGFDGAIISTALHRGIVPIEWIRRGSCC